MSTTNLETVLSMAGTVAVFWLIPRRLPWLRWLLLSAAGFAFLGCVAPFSAILLAGLTLSSYCLAHFQVSAALRYLYAAGAFLLLLILRPTLGGGLVWFGAAFYILRVIHVMIEAERKALLRFRFIDYLAYMAFPPTLSL